MKSDRKFKFDRNSTTIQRDREIMTKKHFEMIASEIAFVYSNATGGETTKAAVAWLATNLAEEFEQANPLFDRDKFLRACGLTPSA
jgi:hypothetical protein